ncbi:hypothetical protein HHI36_008118 [Cryptolaemus montrouzieri]|uniref:G-protein coupled receptors family 1 profile domain-containing protein n=1 Tax=Cryptolaemus montrouzieri TaxID=559131 RepID=A0ABD2MRL4_9CUCU
MISTILALTSTSGSFHLTSTVEYNASVSHYLYTPSTTIDVINGTNLTSNNETVTPVFPSYLRTTSMVFCIIIMCLGVIGNVMVPIVIFKTKDMRNSTNIFLVNLSVADLMVLLVCTPTVLVEVNSRLETWVLGKEMSAQLRCSAAAFIEISSGNWPLEFVHQDNSLFDSLNRQSFADPKDEPLKSNSKRNSQHTELFW